MSLLDILVNKVQEKHLAKQIIEMKEQIEANEEIDNIIKEIESNFSMIRHCDEKENFTEDEKEVINLLCKFNLEKESSYDDTNESKHKLVEDTIIAVSGFYMEKNMKLNTKLTILVLKNKNKLYNADDIEDFFKFL